MVYVLTSFPSARSYYKALTGVFSHNGSLLTPILAIVALTLILVKGNLVEKLVASEAAVLVLAMWGLQRTSKQGEPIALPRIPRRVYLSTQFVLLVMMIGSQTFISSYQRPLIFFVLFSVYFIELGLEIMNSKPPIGSFMIRLLSGLGVFIFSFDSLYPGLVGIDSYRDYYIGKVILENGGGLPKALTGLTWYNFSPLASLSYVSNALVVGIPLFEAELLVGFAIIVSIILTIGAFAFAMTRRAAFVLLSTFLTALSAYFVQWARSPGPELLAISFLFIAITLALSPGFPGVCISAIMVVAVILTHGGVALILSGTLLVLLFVTKRRSLSNLLVFSLFAFVTYVVFASVANAQSAVVTLAQFLRSLLQLAQPTVIVSASQTGALPVILGETVSSSFWWVFLLAAGWLGLYSWRSRTMLRPRLVFALLLIGYIAFAVGLLSWALGPSLNFERYVGLDGFLVVPLLAGIGLMSLGNSPRRRALIYMFIAVLVASAVTAPIVSPDFWQIANQGQYATNNSLFASTTYQMLDAQSYLNAFDQMLVVAPNFAPQFLNLSITSPNFVSSVNQSARFVTFSEFYAIGRGTLPICGPTELPSCITLSGAPSPFLILDSNRASLMGVPSVYGFQAVQSEFANINYTRMNVLYTNSETSILLD
jgi:hypothetical protein